MFFQYLDCHMTVWYFKNDDLKAKLINHSDNILDFNNFNILCVKGQSETLRIHVFRDLTYTRAIAINK